MSDPHSQRTAFGALYISSAKRSVRQKISAGLRVGDGLASVPVKDALLQAALAQTVQRREQRNIRAGASVGIIKGH